MSVTKDVLIQGILDNLIDHTISKKKAYIEIMKIIEKDIEDLKDIFAKWLINHKDEESSMGLDSDDLFHHFEGHVEDCEICKEFEEKSKNEI